MSCEFSKGRNWAFYIHDRISGISTREATPEEVRYLVEGTNRCMPSMGIRADRVISTFAGVRPLAAQEKKDPWAVGRRHKLHEAPNGLISVVGGKFTTFRRIAQDAVDLLARRLPGILPPLDEAFGPP